MNQSKKKYIYLPIEIKSREFLTSLLMVSHLLKKKFKIIICSKLALSYLIRLKLIQKGIIFLNSATDDETYKFYKENNLKIVMLDYELSPALSDYQIKNAIKIRKKNYLKYVDYFFVIGEQYKKTLIKLIPSIKNKIILSGWPRADLWKNNLIYKNKILSEIKKKNKHFYLFSSDFGIMNMSDVYKLNKDFLDKKVEKKTIKKQLNISIKSRNEFKEMIRFLINLEKDKKIPKIIIRPHPVENHFYWKKISKLFKRFEVNFSHDISYWLKASDGLLHRGCTTALQAGFINKKSAYIITKKKYIRHSLTYSISNKINSVQNLKNFFSKKNTNKRKNTNNFEKFIYENNKKSSSEIIADSLNKIEIEKQEKIPISIRKKILLILLEIRDYIRNKYFQKKINNKKKLEDGLSESEILKYLSKFNSKKNFQIKKLFLNCFEIEN